MHGWRKLVRERDGATEPPPRPAALPVKAAASMPQFVPVSMAPTPPQSAPADIRIELRRGATAVKLTWPIAAAAECAAWMRELLR
ncbi:MAG: IS66 family insertion sequence element accessory protein TnpB [Burkholderiales bacterium]